MCGLPSMLSIHSILFEEQVYFVIFGVVALRNQMDSHKPGVFDTNTDKVLASFEMRKDFRDSASHSLYMKATNLKGSHHSAIGSRAAQS